MKKNHPSTYLSRAGPMVLHSQLKRTDVKRTDDPCDRDERGKYREIMSWTQRFVPLAVAASIGIVSGIYIFDPIVRQYTVDAGLAPEHRALLRTPPEETAEKKTAGDFQQQLNVNITKELGQKTASQQQQIPLQKAV